MVLLYQGQEEQERLRGLDTVRVKKDDVLSALQANREEHRQIFEEAIKNWKDQVIIRLEEMVEKAKKDINEVVLSVGLVRPQDHTKDYNRAIKMLEMSQDDELELTQSDFAQFVMDDWGWQRDFLTTSSNYSARAISKNEGMN
jgi:hypothetical protein